MADENHIKILPYDNKVPEIFKEIKKFIYRIIPYQVEVEHIGSTAVVGLGGKRIVDIMIITRQEYMRKIVEVLESKGYKFNPEAGTGIFPERLFVSGSFRYNKKELHIHIHITFRGSKEHKDMLLFRDYLRRHPGEAKTYFKLKKQWSIEVGSDKFKFSELKTPYINKVLEKARKEIGD